MARHIIKQSFDIRLPLTARRSFTSHGRKFKSGDSFQWKDRSIDVSSVRRLFDAGRIYHADNETSKVETSKAETPKGETPNPDRAQIAALGDQSADGSEFSGMKMKALRVIANEEGAPIKTSKAAQIASILDNRLESNEG